MAIGAHVWRSSFVLRAVVPGVAPCPSCRPSRRARLGSFSFFFCSGAFLAPAGAPAPTRSRPLIRLRGGAQAEKKKKIRQACARACRSSRRPRRAPSPSVLRRKRPPPMRPVRPTGAHIYIYVGVASLFSQKSCQYFCIISRNHYLCSQAFG